MICKINMVMIMKMVMADDHQTWRTHVLLIQPSPHHPSTEVWTSHTCTRLVVGLVWTSNRSSLFSFSSQSNLAFMYLSFLPFP